MIDTKHLESIGFEKKSGPMWSLQVTEYVYLNIFQDGEISIDNGDENAAWISYKSPSAIEKLIEALS